MQTGVVAVFYAAHIQKQICVVSITVDACVCRLVIGAEENQIQQHRHMYRLIQGIELQRQRP